MSVSVGEAYEPAAIEANKAGTLSPSQRAGLGAEERAWRKNELMGAFVAAVIGLLVLSSSGGTTPQVERIAIGVVALAVAAVFLVRAFPGRNALARDEHAGTVVAVEGPFGKHMYSGTGRSTSRAYYFDLGEEHYDVGRDAYHKAPDHGMMRLYILPGSKQVVNYERLPDAHLPPGAAASPVEALSAISAGLRSHDQATRLQAMATFGALENTVVANPGAPPPGPHDPRPLAEAIVGTWRFGGMTWTFRADGTASGTLPNGHAEQGRWSVDGSGRLRMDGLGGEPQDADASVDGDQLTVSLNGRGVRFQRVAS